MPQIVICILVSSLAYWFGRSSAKAEMRPLVKEFYNSACCVIIDINQQKEKLERENEQLRLYILKNERNV